MTMNVGIIGVGFFGEMHAQALQEVPGVQLISACRTNQTALDAFCQQFRLKGYTDYRDLLQDPDLDIVVIATPHALHTSIALDAASYGKHILIEKPITLSLEECDEIIAAQEKHGIKLMVGHVNRFSRAYSTAKKILDSGEIGAIVLGLSTMSKYWMEQNRRSWHLDRTTGGGMLLTAGIHCLDRLIWLVDSPVVSVAAQLDTRFHQQAADDAGLMFMRFQNGCFGAVVSVGYQTGAPKHLTELTCTRGQMNIDFTEGVTIGKDEKRQVVEDSGSVEWMHEALIEEWKAFVHSIEHNIKEPVTAGEARHFMEVIFQAELSSQLHQELAIKGDMQE